MVDFTRFYKDKANVGYIVAGYPSLKTTEQFLLSLAKTKIDILEIGLPYSDPLADGQVISEASLKALQAGIGTKEVFALLAGINTAKCLVLLVYYNIIFSYGLTEFVRECKRAKIAALIVPDLPFEENEALFRACEQEGIALVGLVSVTSPKERIERILTRSSGFIYLVASLGITGGKQVAKARLRAKVKEIKALTTLPVFIGFGIKNAKDVASIKQISDGAIVGTSIVECFKQPSTRKIIKKIDEIF